MKQLDINQIMYRNERLSEQIPNTRNRLNDPCTKTALIKTGLQLGSNNNNQVLIGVVKANEKIRTVQDNATESRKALP